MTVQDGYVQDSVATGRKARWHVGKGEHRQAEDDRVQGPDRRQADGDDRQAAVDGVAATFGRAEVAPGRPPVDKPPGEPAVHDSDAARVVAIAIGADAVAEQR